MTTTFGSWQPMTTAPRDGRRILVVVGATEQWPAEVELARWAEPANGAEKSWISGDSGAADATIFSEGELRFWMPLPVPPEGA